MKKLFVTLVVAMLWSSTLAVFTTTDCGTTKSCLRLNNDCDPSLPDCVFFSWKWDGSDFEMEISGGAGNGATYSAVAFGQENAMQDADMYYCTGSNFVSGVIRVLHEDPTDMDATNEPGLSNFGSTTEDGVAKCTFTRSASVTKEISGGVTKNFDLTSDTYYILLARGSVTDGTMVYHLGNKLITSNQINMTEAPSTTASTTNAETDSTTSTTTAEPDSACGNTKGCFQDPTGCAEGSPDCTYFTWAYDSDANTWNMELSGGTGNGATYVGVAFGQSSRMQDADLYFCTGTSVGSGAITNLHAAPQMITPVTGLTNVVAATTNGAAKCSFTRVASVNKPDSSGTHDYDLSSTQYYLLLAKGPMSGNTMQIHSSKVITSETVDFKTNSASGVAGANPLAKAHGALMIAAWLVLANLGVVIARHFRPLWPDIQPGGVKFWFTLHRALMILVLVITAVAFVIIFVHAQGYSSQQNAHAIIGIIVMAFTLINPIMAVFRPDPKAGNRWVFNMFHRFVGLSARGLGIANLFLGSNAIGLSSWATGVLGGFVGFLVLMEIIFEALTWKYGHYSWQTNKKTDEPGDGDMRMEEPNVGVRGQGVKTFLLLVYALGLLAFAITFFVDISNA